MKHDHENLFSAENDDKRRDRLLAELILAAELEKIEKAGSRFATRRVDNKRMMRYLLSPHFWGSLVTP